MMGGGWGRRRWRGGGEFCTTFQPRRGHPLGKGDSGHHFGEGDTTLTAARFNSLLRGFFERLVAVGKPRMQAVGVCIRKLVMLCYGVLIRDD